MGGGGGGEGKQMLCTLAIAGKSYFVACLIIIVI